jgi:uncharacterized protein
LDGFLTQAGPTFSPDVKTKASQKIKFSKGIRALCIVTAVEARFLPEKCKQHRGNFRFEKGLAMKLKKSRFAISTSSETDLNEIHIYNTLHDHLLIVSQKPDETIASLFEKLNSGAPLTEDERSAADVLIKMGVFVEADDDEQEDFEKWYDEVLHGNSDALVLHIATTMACNMRCEYCMEKGQLNQSQFMTHDLAVSVASWIKHKMISQGTRRLSLIFFGGEPLLNTSAIEQISGDMKKFCLEAGTAFKAGIITNGTLLTQEVTDILAEAGISWAKVTLDGDSSTHDRRRHFINGSGTFDLIWENLEYAAKKLEIFIGGNFSKGDEEGFSRLIEKLANASWRGAIRDVRFKPIMEREGGRGVRGNNNCDHSAFSHEQVGRIVALRREIKKAGLPQIDDPNIGPCDFYRDNVITVGADGALYPCSGFLGIRDFIVGSVLDEKITNMGRLLKTLRSWRDKCEDCPYLPICAGGCRLSAYLAGKSLSTPACDRDFFEKLVPHLVAGFRENNRKGGRTGIFA